MGFTFQHRQQFLGPWDHAKGFVVTQFTSLLAQLTKLAGLAEGLTDPYVPSAVLMTDRAGKADFNRLQPTKVAFNSALFSASAGTWTVQLADQVEFRYVVLGPFMFLTVQLYGTTTSAGMGSVLYLTIPGGYRTLTSDQFFGPVYWKARTAGIDGIGRAFAQAAPSDDRLVLMRDTLPTAWESSQPNSFDLGLNLVVPVYHRTDRPLLNGDA